MPGNQMVCPSATASQWVNGSGSSAIRAHVSVAGSYTSDRPVIGKWYSWPGPSMPPNTYSLPSTASPTDSARAIGDGAPSRQAVPAGTPATGGTVGVGVGVGLPTPPGSTGVTSM